MSLGGLTGYAINPARDLGPRLAHAVLPDSGKVPLISDTDSLFRSSDRSSAHWLPYWYMDLFFKNYRLNVREESQAEKHIRNDV